MHGQNHIKFVKTKLQFSRKTQISAKNKTGHEMRVGIAASYEIKNVRTMWNISTIWIA